MARMENYWWFFILPVATLFLVSIINGIGTEQKNQLEELKCIDMSVLALLFGIVIGFLLCWIFLNLYLKKKESDINVGIKGDNRRKRLHGVV